VVAGRLICVFNWIFEQYEQAEFHRGLNGDSSAAWPHNDGGSASMIRLGLCCMFRDQPIKFVTTTATAIGKMKRPDALIKLNRLCMENADALLASLQFCAANNIGCFRINSQILPIKTHPECGYEVTDLPDSDEIIRRFKECGKFVRKHELRTCFHPDQFVVLNSPRADVVDKSVLELEYQAEVAEWVEADVINIHGGGAYGDKQKALADFARNLDRLSSRVRSRLTVENDDKTYTPADLLPICRSTGIPLVYDVHHHRCNSDDLSIEEATTQAMATWNREPMFHISSPIEGWEGPKPERHHDFIDVNDFPKCWRRKAITVEVEAKAKELAVEKLLTELKNKKSDATWFVYLMRCADNSLYTGITNDLPRRLDQHNAGTASRYTRSRLPVVLVYREPQENQSHALKRELAVKALSRQEKESLIKSTEQSAGMLEDP
jgi:UV DNA damage endonuclease